MLTKVKKYFLNISVIAICFTLMVAGICLVTGMPENKDTSKAAGPIVNYNGTDGSGSGTLTDPYIIRSFNTLNTTFRNNAASGKHFVLMSNITTEGNWTPITSLSADSVFDGNGFEIQNLSITSASNRGFITSLSGTIKNVTFTNVSINSTGYAGVVASQITSGNNVLIENVAVEGGNLDNGASTSNRTGGLVGFISRTATASNRASITIKNSYTKDLTIKGGNCTGGIVGFFSGCQYVDLYIQSSYHTGNINGASNIVGGILGGVSSGSNNTITIENCFATGSFISNGTFAGGIMGYQSSAPATVYIRNCFADATLGATSSLGGIFGGGATAGYVQVDNCYYNNQKFTGTVGSNLTNVEEKSKGKLLAEMQTEAFAITLNNGAVPAVWGFTQEGEFPSLIALIQQYIVKFFPNGGHTAQEETEPQSFVFALNEWFNDDWFQSNDVEEPSRIGYIFQGWNTLPNGTGTTYQKSELENIPQTMNLALYAKWEEIQYSIIEERTDFAASQNPMIINGGGATFDKTTIGAAGYIETSLSSSGTSEEFLGFRILKKTADIDAIFDSDWVNLGMGERLTDGIKAYRLSLQEIIDEQFIGLYAFPDNSFVFNAFYKEGAVLQVTVDAGSITQKSYGILKVGDSADSMVNVPFGSTLNFVDLSKTLIIDAIANPHRKCTGFEVNGVPASSGVTVTGYNRRLTITVSTNTSIKAIFESIEYTVNLVGKIGDDTVPGSDYIAGTCPDVKINSIFSGATFKSIDGYRLKSFSEQNVKIWNYTEGKYDYFNANNGNISSIVFGGITSSFLTTYANSATNSIEIIADYVKQARLEVNINSLNSELGEVLVYITTPDGYTYSPSLSTLSVSDYFDVNSRVEIIAIPQTNVSVVIGPTIQGDERYEDRGIQTLIYTLDVNRITNIQFSEVKYQINYRIVESINYDLLSINGLTLTSTKEAAAETETVAFKLDSTGTLEGHNFVKWIIKKGSEELILSTNIAGNDVGSPGYLTIELSTVLVNQWAEYGSITVYAVFAAEYVVKIGVEGEGSYITEVIQGEERGDLGSGGKMYMGGTILRISFTAGSYYEFDSIIGLKGSESVATSENYVYITANEFIRNITLKFKKVGYSIDLVKNLSGGDVEVFSDMNNPGKLSIGDKVKITFNPNAGQQLKTWTINGTDIYTLKNQGVAIVNGNTVILTITDSWLIENAGKEGRIECDITTEMSQILVMVIIASAILIPLSALGAVFLMIQNRKKKEAYAKAVLRMKEVEKGFQIVDKIKNLKEGN